ncbi:hypothetical protein PGTUg99_011243 [Puccinia graminis f. sp. tritici]|uniref:Uncharacterized protein n=1 Tax=Puccinia graminis f. sp. tritici TaxID=56615 RepID=A0A5B0RXF1_PUCGR|nr:hypothetical protein PGTUg99_011243 [Puccinia graminis f. sp. tritici]
MVTRGCSRGSQPRAHKLEAAGGDNSAVVELPPIQINFQFSSSLPFFILHAQTRISELAVILIVFQSLRRSLQLLGHFV